MKRNRILKIRSVLLLIVLAAVLITGCTRGDVTERRYYIFDYVEGNERPELFQVESMPYTMLVQDARIAQTYTRKQIVKRHYGPQIRYLDHDLWGIKLASAVPDLISKRCSRYNIFESCDRDMMSDLPDYQLNVSVVNLEMYETTFLSEARLNIEFSMFKMQDGNEDVPDITVFYSADRTKRLPPDDVEAYVQTINEMILEETDNFVVKVLNEFIGREDTETHIETRNLGYEVVDYSAEVIGDSITTDDRGIGLLYLPNLSGQDNEPFYSVFDKFGNNVNGARFGEELPLPEGNYVVRYGSGGKDNEMYQNVEVRPRWRYNTPPNWGCLVVDVLDEQRNYVKVSYNLFENDDGYDYGIEYPADVSLGETQSVWILKPGTYKVTINSESYNTYRDFTTIEVEANANQHLTLVVEEDETTGLVSLLGAGIMSEDDSGLRDSNWNQNSAIHANFNLQADNSEERDDSKVSLALSGQLDNTFTYQYGRLNYTMKNLMEVGTSKDEEYDEFRIDLDDFDMKNTLILNVISSIGLYGRFDLNTHFFPVYSYDLNYVEIDLNGNSNALNTGADRYKSSPSIFPMVLKEGLGLNFKFLDTSRADMNLRTGLGMRQDFRKDVYLYSDQDSTANETKYKIYEEQESTYSEGIEASLVGDLQIINNLSYSLTADVLFPFDDIKNYSMDMENIFNLKLFKYISLDYRIKFFSTELDGKLDYIANQQSLFLRFTYILR